MLLTIHNLPSTTRYSDVKSLVQSRCGFSEVLLDNLVNEGQCKKVTLGVAEEEDAAMVVRQINGLYVNGKQLYVEKVQQKKTTEQPYRADTIHDQNYPIYQPGDARDVHGVNQPNVPMALNMAFNQLGYNPQALAQDPMMQMMMAQQMMSGMYMMPQQQSVYMGNGSQTPAQLPSLLPSSSQSQYNYQDQNADIAPNNYSNSKKDNRSQNKSSQKRGDGGDRNIPEQGFNRGNPYQLDGGDRNKPEQGFNRGNPYQRDGGERNKPEQGFNRGNPYQGDGGNRNKPEQGFNRGNPYQSDGGNRNNPEQGFNRGNPYQRDGGDRNKPEQGFNRGNPYQQSSTFKIDRRNQAPNNSNEDKNRRNVSNDRMPYQGQSFNRPDDRHSPIYDYGDQRPWESDRSQPSDNRTWPRGQPENHRDAGTSRNRSRSPLARDTYNTSPQRHEREIYGSRSHNEGNDRYDQASKRAYNDSEETWSGRNAPTEREFRDKMREVPAHKTLLQAARQYYDSAKQSSSHNDFYSANRNQPPEPRKRPYPDSATQSSFGNNSKPFTNREDSIRTPAAKPPPQREPPNFKRQKVEPPSGRYAPPQGSVPSSGIPSLLSISAPRGITPSITPTGGIPPLLRDIAPPRVKAPQYEIVSQIGNEPEKKKRSKVKQNTIQAVIRRSVSYRQQAAAMIGKAIYAKCKPEKPISPSQESNVIKIIKGIKLAVYNRIELLLFNDIEVPIQQIIERYRNRFPSEEDEYNLYSAVSLNVEENAAKEEQNCAKKSVNAGPAPVEVKKQSSEAVIKNEMPVPKQEMPVPKQGMPVPKQEMPVPKQGMPVPKQVMPVTKQGMPVPKQVMPVTKQGMPVPKQGITLPKKLPQQSTGPATTAKKGPQPKNKKKGKKGAAANQNAKKKKEVFKLDPLLQEALENELEALNKIFVASCRGATEKDEQAITRRLGAKLSRIYMLNVRLNVLKRLEDVKKTLEVRVSISGKVPTQNEIYQFLLPFGITGFWKEKTICGRPYYLAVFKDRSKYENLCTTISAVMNQHTTLMFKPRPVFRGGKKNPTSSKKKNAKKAGTEDIVDLYSEDDDEDEEESDGDKPDDELFFVDIDPDVEPKQEANKNNDVKETNNDPDVEPKQESDKKNDVKETNNDDTNIDDGGAKANEDDTKECFMVGGEEYQIEDEVSDVKEEDLEDW